MQTFIKPTEQWFTISAAAKLISKKTGRTRLFRFLRDQGLLMENNEPYQEQVDNGNFKMVLKDVTRKDGSLLFRQPVTLISEVGIEYVHHLMETQESKGLENVDQD